MEWRYALVVLVLIVMASSSSSQEVCGVKNQPVDWFNSGSFTQRLMLETAGNPLWPLHRPGKDFGMPGFGIGCTPQSVKYLELIETGGKQEWFTRKVSYEWFENTGLISRAENVVLEGVGAENSTMAFTYKKVTEQSGKQFLVIDTVKKTIHQDQGTEIVETVYSYDDLGRIVKTMESDRDKPTKYSYDGNIDRDVLRIDLPLTLTWPLLYKYEYNPGGLVDTISLNGTIIWQVTNFSYDEQNRLHQYMDNLGDQRRFFYDTKGRMNRATKFGNETLTIRFDDMGRVSTFQIIDVKTVNVEKRHVITGSFQY